MMNPSTKKIIAPKIQVPHKSNAHKSIQNKVTAKSKQDQQQITQQNTTPAKTKNNNNNNSKPVKNDSEIRDIKNIRDTKQTKSANSIGKYESVISNSTDNKKSHIITNSNKKSLIKTDNEDNNTVSTNMTNTNTMPISNNRGQSKSQNFNRLNSIGYKPNNTLSNVKLSNKKSLPSAILNQQILKTEENNNNNNISNNKKVNIITDNFNKTSSQPKSFKKGNTMNVKSHQKSNSLVMIDQKPLVRGSVGNIPSKTIKNSQNTRNPRASIEIGNKNFNKSKSMSKSPANNNNDYHSRSSVKQRKESQSRSRSNDINDDMSNNSQNINYIKANIENNKKSIKGKVNYNSRKTAPTIEVKNNLKKKAATFSYKDAVKNAKIQQANKPSNKIANNINNGNNINNLNSNSRNSTSTRRSKNNANNNQNSSIINRQKSNKTITGKEFDENEDLQILKLKYIEMKRERLQMEKEVDVMENKIKVLGIEEDRAKKNIEREIKTREENLKTINEIALQKDIVLKSKIEQNQQLKKNIAKLSEMKTHIRNTLKKFREQVKEKNTTFAKDYLREKHQIEDIKVKFNKDLEQNKRMKADTIKVQREQFQKKKYKEELKKIETMKAEILKELEKESSMKKKLEFKLDDFSNQENEMKAKLIETKLLDLNSKSMIDLGNHFKD